MKLIFRYLVLKLAFILICPNFTWKIIFYYLYYFIKQSLTPLPIIPLKNKKKKKLFQIKFFRNKNNMILDCKHSCWMWKFQLILKNDQKDFYSKFIIMYTRNICSQKPRSVTCECSNQLFAWTKQFIQRFSLTVSVCVSFFPLYLPIRNFSEVFAKHTAFDQVPSGLWSHCFESLAFLKLPR